LIREALSKRDKEQFDMISSSYDKPGKESIDFSREYVLIKANALFGL
jgi:hypothetical protein